MAYTFNAPEVYSDLKAQWVKWANTVNAQRWVVGISGGKDSTVIAAMAADIFGKENVYGVMIPRGKQADLEDCLEVIRVTGINYITVNIEESFNSIMSEITNQGLTPTEQANINLSPRLRMSVLFAVAQSINGCVLNTCNLSENLLGYSTLFGDDCGSYSPFKNLTVTEIRQIGKLPKLNLPVRLVDKVPSDGLQALTDEDRLGIKYAVLDKFVREGIWDDLTMKDRFEKRFAANKFKLKIINIDGPVFNDFKNYVLN